MIKKLIKKKKKMIKNILKNHFNQKNFFWIAFSPETIEHQNKKNFFFNW